jgi:hypothetical protein
MSESDHITGLRRTVRHAIAKRLPRVLLRISVQERDGAFVAMFGATLRAILADLGPMTPAAHGRLGRVAGALLLTELRGCGLCPEPEFQSLQEAVDQLHTGMLRSQLAWWLRKRAECEFLAHWASGDRKPGPVTLDELETAFCPQEEQIDRGDELNELKARGFKVAVMCRALRISRKAFYGKWLRNIWPDDGPEANRIRAFYREYNRNTS